MNSDPSGDVAATGLAQPDTVTASVAAPPSSLDRVLDPVRPFLYPALIVLATAIVFLGQLVEDQTDSPPLQMFQRPPDFAQARWAVVALVVYSMIMPSVISWTKPPSTSSWIGRTPTETSCVRCIGAPLAGSGNRPLSTNTHDVPISG